jgi:hypothetical protein
VFGGYDGKKSSNDLWVLYTTPGKMKWERPLTSGIGPRPTDSHTAVRALRPASVLRGPVLCAHSVADVQVLLGTRMLVIGGWDHRVPSNDLYFLDTSTPADLLFICAAWHWVDQCTCMACHVCADTLVWYKPFASGEAPAPRWSHAVTLSSKNRCPPLFAVSRPVHDGLTCLFLAQTVFIRWVEWPVGL